MIRVAIVGRRSSEYARIGAALSATGHVEMVSAEPCQMPGWAAGQTDVIIYDLARTDTVGCLREIRLLAGARPVLVISDRRCPVEAASALRAGASGYLTWNERDAAKAAALLCAGLATIAETPSGAAATLWRASDRFQIAQERLSQREREVLGYITRGFTHQQAATRMGVSKTTVDTYVARVRSKLNAGNKAELTLAGLAIAFGPPADRPPGK